MQQTEQTPPDYDARALLSRRKMLQLAGGGFGLTALCHLLDERAHGAAAAGRPIAPLAAKAPHIKPRAKRAIFLFMPGGPSQVDTFDPKPRLTRDHGLPAPQLYRGQQRKLMASPFKFQKYGESGLEVSEVFPNLAARIDDICVLRSMVADDLNHPGGVLQMNTGERVFSRPSLGAWLTYGLGTENQNLPGFIAIGPGPPIEGARQYGASFLPSAYQGTFVSDLGHSIRNLESRPESRERQRRELDALAELNRLHLGERAHDDRLNAQIEAFELAYRMQAAAPEAFDLDQETASTRRLYGIDEKATDCFGRQCLLGRRLLERGVRFVQLYHTTGGFQPWDQHTHLKSGLEANALATDLPIAGLLTDLKNRGLLEDTLVIWGGEFGRTPAVEDVEGRDHHPFGFTMWLAGGGVRTGMAYGATDEYGWDVVENKVHVHDLHATILHILGLDHEKLTYEYSGRNYRLTDVYGRVVHDLLS